MCPARYASTDTNRLVGNQYSAVEHEEIEDGSIVKIGR